MTLTDEQIEEIKARADAATPGPWDTLTGSVVRAIKGDFAVPIFESRAPVDWHKNKRLTNKVMCAAYADEVRNATFIAHARTDIPLLISALESEKKRADEAEAELTRLREEIEQYREAARGQVVIVNTASSRIKELEAEVVRLRGVVEEADITLSHARTFVTTREKMHPTGVSLYDALLARISALKGNHQ